MTYPGKLIVIEGGDASGKATQTEALKVRLEKDGLTVKTTSFPRYDHQIGGLIGECLRGERGEENHIVNLDPRLASVLYAADRFDAKAEIIDWLENGFVVILDRYTTANLLHQGSKVENDTERKELIEWIYRLEHELFDLPIPDTVFFLDVPAEIRSDLQEKDKRTLDSAEKNLEHQKAVDERAGSILSVYKNTYKIDCAPEGQLRTVADISEEIYNRVK